MVRPQLLDQYVESPANAGSFPPLWENIFSAAAPLKVEVGFGSGEYLAWWAANETQSNFVGIELPHEGIIKASRAASLEKCDNIRLVRGDARYLLRELFAPASVQKVLMQFPMPWPKEKHAKHRVSNSRFTETLADILIVGGEFELVTDQEWYAREAWEHFAADDCFTLSELEVNPERPFRTRYESKWLEEGRSIFRFTATLKSNRLAKRLISCAEMHHVHIENNLTSASISSLKGFSVRGQACVGEIKEVLAGETSWLLKVVSSDDSFSQFFGLRLVDRGDGKWLLKGDEHPRPYPTPAVRFLIEELGEKLNSLTLQ